MGIENQPKSFMEWVKKIRSHGKVFHDEGLYHIETSPLIWKSENQSAKLNFFHVYDTVLNEGQLRISK